MFEFCIEHHEVFGSLTQNRLQLDKDNNTVSTFSVILVNNYPVITTERAPMRKFSVLVIKGLYQHIDFLIFQ